MTRRALAYLLPFALVACATKAAAPTPPPAPPAATAPQPPAASPLLPKVPQPPERPVAPVSVTDPLIPQAQRIEAFVDYAVGTYQADPAFIRAALAQAQ